MPYMTVWVPNNVLGQMNYEASFAEDKPLNALERARQRLKAFEPKDVKAGADLIDAERNIRRGRRGLNMNRKWHEKVGNNLKWLGEDALESAMRNPGRATAFGVTGLGAAGYGGYKMLTGGNNRR